MAFKMILPVEKLMDQVSKEHGMESDKWIEVEGSSVWILMHSSFSVEIMDSGYDPRPEAGCVSKRREHHVHFLAEKIFKKDHSVLN